VTPSEHSVTLRDFYITPAQAGLGDTTNAVDQRTAAMQADITQEYAGLMAAREKRERKHYDERREKREKRIKAFKTPGPVYSNVTHFSRRSQKRRSRPHSPVPTTTSSSTTTYTTEEQYAIPEDTEAPEIPEDDNIPDDLEAVHASESTPMETQE
jgi:hypothetical protein